MRRNYFNKKNYYRLDAKEIEETHFSDYTEVSSASRNTRIESVTNETCGSTSNLSKIKEPGTEFVSVQEEFRDGWIVRRNIDIAM
ncbi:hypothetical protein BD770DRAFT_446701 [Pilaira anomala]|nr:hypothetical protein BD770DRAFT_446701 [Pilaira anomala]